MILKTDENELIQAFSRLIKLPIPELRASLAHKALELEYRFKDEIEEYREIESLIDPESKQEKPTGVTESVELLNFELEKIKGEWTVFPLVHPDVINHILAHAQECEPGIIKMEKITIDGDKFDLGFVKKNENFFTGQITRKCSEKVTKQSIQETPSKQTRSTANKTEDLKTLLTYLLNNEFLFNVINELFLEKWKPLIDHGIINHKVIEG
jgi:hypothetical protein